MTAVAAVLLVVLPPGAAAAPFRRAHSPRPPLTAENFDFVMPDRSDDGSPANDLGRLRAGRPPSRLSTRPPRAFYHGGHLAGSGGGVLHQGRRRHGDLADAELQERGRPAPGRAVGRRLPRLWVTDVTQIDPAPDTNAELAEFVAGAHGIGMEVFFDIITNHRRT